MHNDKSRKITQSHPAANSLLWCRTDKVHAPALVSCLDNELVGLHVWISLRHFVYRKGRWGRGKHWAHSTVTASVRDVRMSGDEFVYVFCGCMRGGLNAPLLLLF